MSWPELTGHLKALNRRRDRQTHGVVTPPDTWAGADQDPFWQPHRARRGGGR